MFSSITPYLNQIKMTLVPDTKDMPGRRYDLDWLRVIVFGLLILFHTGMFYVTNWGWHVKSTYQSQWLENIMLVIEPWRMPAIWLIAGISIRFVLAKVSISRYIAMRSIRLLLPLLVGVLIIVPPQLYVEMTYNGDLNMDYWQFLQVFFQTNHPIFTSYNYGIWPHMDVNHLWFVRSLWQYSLAILVLLPILNSKRVNTATQWVFRQKNAIAIVIAILPIFIIQVVWQGESDRYPLGFTFLLYGYLIGWNRSFWQRLKFQFRPLAIIALVCYLLLVLAYNYIWLDVITGKVEADIWVLISLIIYASMRVIGALLLLSLAISFLNRSSKLLDYLNEAVFPFYILHQTIIVVVGFYLSSFGLGPVIEPILLLFIAIIGCFVGFEIIRRSNVLRPCFGLKVAGKYSPVVAKLGYYAALITIMPIAVEILI